MYEAYNGSNAIRLILKTLVDFTSEQPTEIKILYTDPDGNSGEWTAGILSGGESEGKVYYDLTTNDELTAGAWIVRAKMIYSDGRVLYTKPVKFLVGE